MDVDKVTWIVAADSCKARFFEERRRAGPVREHVELALFDDEPAPPHHRHRATVHERFGLGRHGAGERDWKEERIQHFLERVAEQIDEVLRGSQSGQLVLIAPPRVLGVLKGELSSLAKTRTVATDPHDRIKVPADAIRTRLRDIRLGA